jgi:signal transduction histidine kinase
LGYNNSANAEKKHIKLTTQLLPELTKICADHTRISQVLDNFVSNAIKFCSKNDHIIIKISQSQSILLTEIEDDGPGLSEDDLQRVFVKFARLQNQPTGGEKSTGLGLSICKQIIELHSGNIGVRNNKLKGATFWFSLPIAQPENQS